MFNDFILNRIEYNKKTFQNIVKQLKNCNYRMS